MWLCRAIYQETWHVQVTHTRWSNCSREVNREAERANSTGVNRLRKKGG